MTELSEEMFSNPYYCLFEILRSQSLYFFGYLEGLGLGRLFPGFEHRPHHHAGL